MGDSEQVSVTLQTGAEVRVDAWPGPGTALPVVIAAPGTSADDWDEFTSRLVASRSPVLAGVSSALELLLLIWEIGEPVLLLSQGTTAATWANEVVGSAPGAVTALAVCDGNIPVKSIGGMHAVPTLIRRGRQGKLQSNEDAVRLHAAIPRSMLIEPEDCDDFPAKDNPDAAAAALNLFIAESGRLTDDYSDSEPVDPKS